MISFLPVKAVLFDIYGTLLMSAAGEIHPDSELRAAIANAHARSPHPFPEVDIRDLHGSLHPHRSPEEIERLALEHERRVNPVALMPGADDALRYLASRGLPLGLVSNAQFYTVPALEECLGGSLESFGIDPALCCFSYLEGRAKPDPFLFKCVRGTLAGRGIPAESVLYVGNDVRNDIDPARQSGFRTALFAGDDRSLQLRGRSLDDSGADLVLTDLRQLGAAL